VESALCVLHVFEGVFFSLLAPHPRLFFSFFTALETALFAWNAPSPLVTCGVFLF
jgi:hypothetical protein